jgi:alpha,alpha-trehalase
MTRSEDIIFPISPRLYDAVIFDFDAVIIPATAGKERLDGIRESSIALIRKLRTANFRTAIVSPLKDCPAVLKRTGMVGLFDVIVDGDEIEQRHLQGKPHPDVLLVAAWQLGIKPTRAVVIEDTAAGVESGRLGGFGCVIGIDRGGLADALREQGADVVVSDLAHVVLGDAVSSQ